MSTLSLTLNDIIQWCAVAIIFIILGWRLFRHFVSKREYHSGGNCGCGCSDCPLSESGCDKSDRTPGD